MSVAAITTMTTRSITSAAVDIAMATIMTMTA
jgi:hypothetical protein